MSTNMSTPTRTGWIGWVIFAGAVLVIAGLFSVIQGLAALIGPNDYYLVAGGTVWLLDVNGWGWWNLIIGVLLVLTAVALFAGQTWARIVAIVLAGLNALGQIMQIPAQPWWSITVIAVDILVIYALTVHGHELRPRGDEAGA